MNRREVLSVHYFPTLPYQLRNSRCTQTHNVDEFTVSRLFFRLVGAPRVTLLGARTYLKVIRKGEAVDLKVKYLFIY